MLARTRLCRVPTVLRRIGLAGLVGCGLDGPSGPSDPRYFMLIQDAPCGSGMVPDTVIQPGYRPGSPNAGSGFIDSTASGDRPPRAVFWILGASRTTGNFGVLTFILAHRPTPLPAGMYPIRPLADSTVWLEDYTAPYVGAGFPTDMNTARVGGTDFIIEPIVGSIVVDESDATGFVGNFSLRGSYAKDGVMRCLIASGRFSTRPN